MQSGDKFALLPNEYWYKIKICDGENNTSFPHNFEVDSHSNTSFSHNSVEPTSNNNENCRNQAKEHTPAWVVHNSVQIDPILLEKRVLDVSEAENEQPSTSSGCKRKNSDFSEPENTKVIKQEVEIIIKSEKPECVETESVNELQEILNEDANSKEKKSNEQETEIKMEVLVHNEAELSEETEQQPCNTKVKKETLSDEENLPTNEPVQVEDINQPSCSSNETVKKEDGQDEDDKNMNAQDDSGKKKKFRDRCWYGQSCYRCV